MTIEDHVTSLELSTKLFCLGVRNTSIFCWRQWIPPKGSTHIEDEWKISLYKGSMDSEKYRYISAFLASELKLPKDIIKYYGKDEDDFHCYYLTYDDDGYPLYDFDTEMSPLYEQNETEANARAKMIIWLYQNGYIKND